MGNEDSCCYDGKDLNQIEQYNSINPIKYGSKIKNFRTAIPQVQNSQTLMASSNHHKNQSNINQSKEQVLSAFDNKNNHQNHSDSSSKKSDRKQERNQLDQPFFQELGQYDFQGDRVSGKSQIFSKHNNKLLGDNQEARSFNQSRNHEKVRLQFDDQIDVKFKPTIQELFRRQKPFEKQFQEIPAQELKTAWVNSHRDVFKGQVDKMGRPQGYGLLIIHNGNVLVGSFVNGIIEGDAFYAFTDGSFYVGNMKENKAYDLKGQFHSQQFSYLGGLQNNAFNGQGEQLGQDYHFKGHYENGHRKQGVFSWDVKRKSNKKLSHSGSATNINKINSQNPKYDENIQTTLPPRRDFRLTPKYNFIYTGSFNQNQQFQGYGELIQPQGTYKGHFKNGKKHGKGTFAYQSQIFYEGQYFEGVKQGFGKVVNADNTIGYQGQWQNDLPHGKGYTEDSMGRKVQGEFIQGLNICMLSDQSLRKDDKIPMFQR